MKDLALHDRARGCALGAVVGDALGMPLEFTARQPADQLVRTMRPGRLPAGTFTDDTEMALALAESLLTRFPLNPDDLAGRFVQWYRVGPDDVGVQTQQVLSRMATGSPWRAAVEEVQRQRPEAAGNGSVMRCWPVALAHHTDTDALLADSALQSFVTHPHPECIAGSELVNLLIQLLMAGIAPAPALERALETIEMPDGLRAALVAAPGRRRDDLKNSGWVRHTLESAVWGLLSTGSFEDALVKVVNLGGDADSAGAVVGMLAGATYGLAGIPVAWQEAVQGRWPIDSRTIWRASDIIALADGLLALGDADRPSRPSGRDC